MKHLCLQKFSLAYRNTFWPLLFLNQTKMIFVIVKILKMCAIQRRLKHITCKLYICHRSLYSKNTSYTRNLYSKNLSLTVTQWFSAFLNKWTVRIITFCVSRRRRKMYCGHAHLCVCLSTAASPHYCTDPDVTWGSGRGCPLVVHSWADLQSVHGLHCCGNITRTLVTSLRPSRDMMI